VLSGTTLYGMTPIGGDYNDGVVFKVGTNGAGYSNLYSFNAGSFSAGGDGSQPMGSLVLNGSTLYGMTSAQNLGFPTNYGTVFGISTSGGTPTYLHYFTGGPLDGAYPFGSLIFNSTGTTLYGMTSQGGSLPGGGIYSGMTFQVTTGGTFTTGHQFNYSSATDGGFPNGTLIRGGSTVYGMASQGGTNGEGVIFKEATNNASITVLYSFANGTDGAFPGGTLVLGGTTLYGMAPGGANGHGVIFSLSTGAGFNVLHAFTGTDGDTPGDALTLSSDGTTLYGMTTYGGANGQGEVFSIDTSGNGFQVLDSFNGANGANPYGDLTLSADGQTLYGMSSTGDINGAGNIFTLAVPEPATMALLAMGALGLITARKRRA
jgi:uncharacterized repeat protein (TIGR03803 family)